MENRIYRIFRSLKLEEVKQLQKIIDAPIYAVPPVIKQLFGLLARQRKKMDTSSPDKQELFQKLYPDKAYKDIKLRRHFSDLSTFITDFLSFNTLYKDTWLREKALAETYEDAKLYAFAQEKRQLLHDFIDQDRTKNDQYWKKKMILYQMELDSSAPNKSRTNNEILQDLLVAGDYYFAFVKVRQALLTISRTHIFKSDTKVQFLPAIKREYQNGFLQENRLFILYYLALQLTEAGRDDLFFAYENLFFDQQDDIYGEDRLFFFYMGLNYAVRQSNKGITTFKKVALDWYKFALKEEILLYNNSIDKASFGNIVFFGCQAKEEEWTLEFIAKYIKYLPASIQQEELTYSNAVVYFYQKRYHLVIENIEDYSFSQPYIIKTKVILLRSYFEEFTKDVDYFQVLIYNINSFQNYLKRNKNWTEKVKRPHLNLCRVLKKLAKLYLNNIKKEEIEKWLLMEIEKRPIISAKKWLLGKITR